MSLRESTNQHSIETSTEELCKILNVDELDLASHPLYLRLSDFMKVHGDTYQITAFQKRVDGGYLVQVSDKKDKKQFGSVRPGDLAAVLGIKLGDLEEERNVHILEAERSGKVNRQDILP